LGAFALRLVQLGRESLWYDETVSVHLAGQRAAELIAHTARDIHPPLYYLLLRGWLLLASYPTGQADPASFGLEFMAAFMSLFLGVLLVPLTWQLARRLGLDSLTAGLAALLIAISPFGVWYSQEVRMYTLGACLGVVVLLATIPFLRSNVSPGRLRRAALLYAVAAAAGMYTLYYFAFLLLSLNVLVLVALTSNGLARSGDRPEQGKETHTFHVSRLTRLFLWLAAQAGALLLFLPWLPTAWRQATDPPVPPWRTAPQLLDVLVESWTAFTLGQSADPARFWPLLLLALALVVTGIIASRRARSGASGSSFIVHHSSFLLVAALGPLLLILLASLWTPLYHVRYLFTFSPAWSVLLAMGLAALWRWGTRLSRALALTSLILLLAGSAVALRSFWHDPAYAADDHRTAVRELAQRWRPGDVILANAGYTYTALLTYWPGSISWHGRLTDYTQIASKLDAAQRGVVILQTGHIDGDPAIGWGDPRSDFYALPLDVTQAALSDLSTQADRLWQYRIYDTVNDPQGAIRDALAAGWTLADDRVYPGEANLRVQGWQGMRSALSSYLPPTVATFDGWLELRLAPAAMPSTIQSGDALDIPGALWTRSPDQMGRPVALSLRLVDANGEVWAAADGPLGGNVLELASASQLVQPLRLAVPAGTAPGIYSLVLVVYEPQTGQPLPAGGAAANQAVLGAVEVTRPVAPPVRQPVLADFGPLRVIEATTPAAVLSPGDSIPVELLWQGAPDFQAEPLVVVVQLLDSDDNVAASLEAEPLGGRYPTTQWQPKELVRDRHVLLVPDGVAPGTYRLIVGLYRAADGQRLTAISGPFGLAQRDHFLVSEVEVR
jgi:uncharacterized membrane protein